MLLVMGKLSRLVPPNINHCYNQKVNLNWIFSARSHNKRYVKEASQGNILFPFGEIRHNASGKRYPYEGERFSPRVCLWNRRPQILRRSLYAATNDKGVMTYKRSRFLLSQANLRLLAQWLADNGCRDCLEPTYYMGRTSAFFGINIEGEIDRLPCKMQET
mgnify:CR=1 FL=1|jgi:hypothetical protein